ncbi:ionic transporter y4hA [Tardiphaga sp. P9-11]|jgi:Ca2+:H+ antiporter|uniref:calcium:proton antiporter n=1 Tax=Tardiphaga sp. P9-11 TaxID=2024614 RepID=UPI0011F18316|nr:ionic transporter y4hA [Tardiphaga sp. P9-11]KAA0074018.1 ionic transporter y4hA [Tardiphaga sp. P9-11]
MSVQPVPKSSWIFPALAVAFVAATTALSLSFTPSVSGLMFAAVLLVILFGTVFAAVHHAEVIAHKIGEPYGTLLLTLSVIIIEVAVIATIMIGDKSAPTLARDTVFAVVMIVCNGLVGLCILAGGLRYTEQEFQVSGAKVYLSVLIVLSTITLILPNYTLTTPGPLYSALQLAFVSVVTMILYGLFLYTQTVLHRDYFINDGAEDDDGHPPAHSITMNGVLLVVSLVAVVLLAKSFSVVVDAGGAAIGAPPAFTGIVVALLVLLPESVAAISAARHNKLQKSINLSLGSALATISLTIPAVALAAYLLGKPLLLGLPQSEMVLLIMTFAISMLTFATGVTNILFGMVHMLVFAVFLLTVFAP